VTDRSTTEATAPGGRMGLRTGRTFSVASEPSPGAPTASAARDEPDGSEGAAAVGRGAPAPDPATRLGGRIR
jgi:hypothetical protein